MDMGIIIISIINHAQDTHKLKKGFHGKTKHKHGWNPDTVLTISY